MQKRIFISFSLLIFTGIVHSQDLNGTGSESDPYSGTITSNTTWSQGSRIFAEDLTIAAGCSLVISPGAYDGTFLNMLGYNLTIQNGASFIIDPLAAATIDGIINNGRIILESFSGEPGIASLIFDSYSGTGVSQIKLYLSGGITAGTSYIWHYITVPISGISASSFSTLDLVRYVESLSTSTDNTQSWIAWDGYQYSTGNFLPQYAFSNLSIGKGYNYYSAAGGGFTFDGIINSSSNIQYLSYSGSSSFQGFNLVGNPFSSCIDWEYLCPTYTRSVNNAIYYTNRGSFPAYVSGIGTDGGTQFIPPLQGFFVKANASNGRIIFSTGARTHQFDQMRYKKGIEEDIPEKADTITFFRIQLKNEVDSTDFVVRFNPKATTSVDPNFDAYKLNKTAGDLNIWTKTGSTDYSINGLPFPEGSFEMPVGLNVKTPGTFRIWLKEMNKLENFSVYLKDLVTNITVDLKSGEEITFNIPSGIIENRFVLRVTNITTGVPEIQLKKKLFSVFSNNLNIKILSLTDEFSNSSGSITVFDMMGRTLYQEDDIIWQDRGDLKQIPLNFSRGGLYIVEILAGSRRFTEKVIIN
jgi:hypothetical protein